MELQSRFGTDERFRMDSRFLEEDEAQEGESGEAVGGGAVRSQCVEKQVKTVMRKG